MDSGNEHAATKRCAKCGVEKPLPEFYLRRESGRRRNTCRVCEQERARRARRERRRAPRRAQAHEPLPDAPWQMKACITCGIEKPIVEFDLRSDTRKRRGECRLCQHERMRRNYRARLHALHPPPPPPPP